MRIIITSDFVPTDFNMHLFEEGNIEELFADVPELFSTADRVVVNLECALTETGEPIPKFGPNLKAVPNTAKVMKDIGVTDCSLSNNHVLDFGVEGLKNTLKHIEDSGLNWTGVGENDTDSRKPLLIQGDDKTVAIISVCEHEYTYALPNRMGANPYDPYKTMDDIREARENADYVVVLYHGGKEYCHYPSPRLRDACQAMVRNGADIVLCQHSHCIGTYEEYEDSYILYGQGNFHFVKDNDFEGWHSGFIAILDIDEECKITFEPIIRSDKGTGIVLAKDEKRQELMEAFKDRSKALESDLWLEGWEDFCKSVKETYLGSIGNAYTKDSTERENEHFGHYLDCEAHTDVWRTICKTWHHEGDK